MFVRDIMNLVHVDKEKPFGVYLLYTFAWRLVLRSTYPISQTGP